ncbi:spermidine/putrescine transport system ATP-binding protein [Seinonella peptonophila]|uniref:Spermidine/putrescine import ATP-binding protein PotA n=1 Tax=Seinonella peptonophila TaxID=112248 RepID=A0A1M5BK00_9BACL|nr:ABC transporter ATP-binding protein [Seinonella peptonophila]SHF42786.1 spermidine/putrescine transport system ATP-binding protein [Seinonella peptonophila]
MTSPYIIEMKNVSKIYGQHPAVDNISLDIYQGEFLSILGPSGCGKTTTLRMIAGFEYISKGTIMLDGKEASHVPPYQRPVNTVFQNYALFPHMTIFNNIAFGLKRKGMKKQEIKEEVDEMLETMGLEEHRDKYPTQLSGGQQQRVALARALINKPKVLLLDEPLAALDLKLRKKMQFELKRLHKQVGITFIFVTHDQEEALVLSDRIVVMREGEIEQVGTSEEIYKDPLTSYVAQFIGDANVLPTKKNNDGTVSALGYDFPVGKTEEDYHFIIRPEHIELHLSQNKNETDMYQAPITITEITYAGSKQIVEVECMDQTIYIHCSPEQTLSNANIGQKAMMMWKKEHHKILK